MQSCRLFLFADEETNIDGFRVNTSTVDSSYRAFTSTALRAIRRRQGQASGGQGSTPRGIRCRAERSGRDARDNLCLDHGNPQQGEAHQEGSAGECKKEEEPAGKPKIEDLTA